MRRFGEREALAGVTLRARGGADPRGARPQRRRQDHAAARARDAAVAARWIGACARPRASARGAPASVAESACSATSRCSTATSRGRENLAFYARLYEVPERGGADRRAARARPAWRARADEPVRNLSRGMAQRARGLPGGAAPPGAPAARRAARAPRPRGGRAGRAADRPGSAAATRVLVTPRRRARRSPRPTACSALRDGRVAVVERRRADLTRRRRCAPSTERADERRRGDRAQGPAGRAAHEGVGARDGAVRGHDLRASSTSGSTATGSRASSPPASSG